VDPPITKGPVLAVKLSCTAIISVCGHGQRAQPEYLNVHGEGTRTHGIGTRRADSHHYGDYHMLLEGKGTRIKENSEYFNCGNRMGPGACEEKRDRLSYELQIVTSKLRLDCLNSRCDGPGGTGSCHGIFFFGEEGGRSMVIMAKNRDRGGSRTSRKGPGKTHHG
jgi:hypothetical protein